MSLVGVDREGTVDAHEHIFDLYTKLYDFDGVDVEVLSAQDLLRFYRRHNILKRMKGYFNDSKKADIYTLVEYFIQKHDGHFILDECPFLSYTYTRKFS